MREMELEKEQGKNKKVKKVSLRGETTKVQNHAGVRGTENALALRERSQSQNTTVWKQPHPDSSKGHQCDRRIQVKDIT